MVTGVGLVTPLGIGQKQSWQQLLAGGKSGRTLNADEIDHFEQLATLLKRLPAGAPVDHQQVACYLRDDDDLRFVGQGDCLNNMVAYCLNDAVADASLSLPDVASNRIGCAIGTSKASLRAMESELHPGTHSSTVNSKFDLWRSGFMPDSPLSVVQQLIGSGGPSSCSVAACATGLFSVIEGASYIQSGLCDVCVVGSADASLRSSVLAGFHRLGVTSRNEDAASACRPFDCNRDGFIVGEGAAIMILESRQHQEQRNASAYAQITHGRSLTDPTGVTQIDSTGRVVAELLRQLNCPEADFISLHGTGTETNDQAEANGVSANFTDQQPICFGTKGATGHLLGAAASVEFGLACLAMKHAVVPGTANHTTTDPACPIQVCPNSMTLPQASSAIKLSLGFGGHVVGCVLRKA